MDIDVDNLVDAIESTRIVSYVTAGCIALLTYDSFLTMGREVNTVWMGRWTPTKILYIITRYSAFAEAGVLIYQLSIPGEWYGSCLLAFKLNTVLFLLGLGFGEIIMTLRTWAVWGKNRVLMFTLPVFYLAIWAGGFAATAVFLLDLKFEPHPITPYVGCYATHTNFIIFVSWVLLLLYDAAMFVLMSIPAFKAFRAGGGSSLMITVYRDGVIYYLYLFALSLINIIVTLTFPTSLILIFSLLSRILHAILACRVVLDIHELGSRVLVSQEQGRNGLPHHRSARFIEATSLDDF